MKKSISVLLVLLLVACTNGSQTINDEQEVETVGSGNGQLYQAFAETPLLTDNSYFSFYSEYSNSDMGENHSELVCTNYWKVSDMLYHFEYKDSNEDTFTLKETIYGLEDDLKYDEMYQTRNYDMTVIKDESYWFDYAESGELIQISLSIAEYGNHAPYNLIATYSLEDDLFDCERNDLSNEYPDGGKEAIEQLLSDFKYESIDSQQLLNDLETDLYFYYEDTDNDYSIYIGPNSLEMLLTSINQDEEGRYILGFSADGSDNKLYVDDDMRVIKLVSGSKTTTYEYLEDYVVATYKHGKEQTIYKYDYQRNLINE